MAFFSTKPPALPELLAVENGCLKPVALSEFSISTQDFPKNDRFGVYFKISTGGSIRTAVIIGQFTL